MLKELIVYLFNFAKASERIALVDKVPYHVNGENYKRINPPTPEAISTSGLNGVVGYIKKELSDNKDLRLAVTCDVNALQVRGVLDPVFRGRECYLTTSFGYFDFRFGQYYGVEEFIIKLQSQFDTTEDLSGLLKLVGNIKDGQVIQRQDDGITQEVTAKVGITRLDTVPLVNPVKLKPKRTFAEIDQVETAFIIRGRSGQQEPTFALFEADGGAWQIEAVKRIQEYLKKEIGDAPGILII